MIPLIVLLLVALFQFATYQQKVHKRKVNALPDSLIAFPPVLTLGLYAGDRYLAANIETVRIMAAPEIANQSDAQNYYQRVHSAVSLLNPCHQDNYYIANARLSWGGSQDEAFKVLARAVNCRYWDEWPPFLYGFNMHYFRHDTAAAVKALEIAATRSVDNKVAFKRVAVMLQARSEPNTLLALRFLESERKMARDLRLRKSLNLRIARLQGLLALEDAQKTYELRFRKKLDDPSNLIRTGVMQDFPKDPLGIGYEFDKESGRFRLKDVKIGVK